MIDKYDSNKDRSQKGSDPLVKLIREQTDFQVGVDVIGVIEDSEITDGVVERLVTLADEAKAGRKVTKIRIQKDGVKYEAFYFVSEEVESE